MTFEYTEITGKMYTSIWIARNTYIIANGQKYYLTKNEGISLTPNETFVNWGESKSFKLYFPAIPISTYTIDLIDGSNYSTAWNFWGIHL